MCVRESLCVCLCVRGRMPRRVSCLIVLIAMNLSSSGHVHVRPAPLGSVVGSHFLFFQQLFAMLKLIKTCLAPPPLCALALCVCVQFRRAAVQHVVRPSGPCFQTRQQVYDLRLHGLGVLCLHGTWPPDLFMLVFLYDSLFRWLAHQAWLGGSLG